MPHGFKRDMAVTRAMRASKFFLDSRSFVTHLCDDGKVHFHLEGIDRTVLRAKCFARSKGICEERGCVQTITWDTFEMHHIKGGLTGRCDCLHNVTAICARCHREKHVQVAREEFNKIYQEG
jgi:hypothetical protein